MLAADAELDVGPRPAAALRRHGDEFADALLVERDERIGRQDALGRVGAEERGRVVARDAERRLREVVGAEGEELGRFGDLARPAGTRAAARSSCRCCRAPSTPVSAATASAMATMRALTRSSSSRVITSGTMISASTGRAGLAPGLRRRPRRWRAPASRRSPDRRSRGARRGSPASG